MARADHPPADPPGALPRGTRLGEFELRRVLGIGGFGIVYLAFDHALEREVAIKEYMPTSLVGRDGAMAVSLLSQAHAEPFSLGLRSFVNEARLLARFDHPSLVKVLRYWEANNTAYMAMPCYAGSNLHAVRRAMVQPPGETWLRGLLEPLLGALERLHGEAVYHRDISPDNVILQPDGRPVLLDFGAARRVLGDKSLALTAILKPAYAPIEQYAEAGAVKQGPWTDLYSLGGTLHYLLLGRAPVPATARTVVDELPSLAGQAAQLPGCSVGFLQCVDWMLQPRPADRPQNVAALRARLASLPPAPVAAASTGGDAWPRTQWLGDAAPGHAPTVLDPSLVPATVLAPPAPDTRPTVLMPRTDTRPPDATEVMPRGHPPTPASAAAGMTGAVPATTPSGRNGLDGAPPASHGSAASPDTPAASASLASPAAPAVPAPAARSVVPASPASSLAAAAASRTEPTLDGGTTPFADLPHTARLAPRAAPPTRRWPLAVGAMTVIAIALWLALRPGDAPPQPAAPTLAAPGSGPVDAAADTASAPTGSIAATAPPASTPDSASSEPAALQPAIAAVMAATSPLNASSAPANRKATRTPAGAVAGASPPSTVSAPTSTSTPTSTAIPTTAAAIPPPLANAATPNGAPPSLATSITRLPPADTSAALASPAASAAPTTRLPPTVPGAEAGRPAAGSHAGATPTPTPSAPSAISGKAPATAQPRTVDRDAEPVLLQARALSPAERCEGRALAALWSCIDRQCKAEPGLRDHPDCAKARREAEQRATPSR